MEHGVGEIIPVATLEKPGYKEQGHIVAAERGGKSWKGLTWAILQLHGPRVEGQTVVLTTTNGTKAINMAKDKPTVVVGALNNLDALCLAH